MELAPAPIATTVPQTNPDLVSKNDQASHQSDSSIATTQPSNYITTNHATEQPLTYANTSLNVGTYHDLDSSSSSPKEPEELVELRRQLKNKKMALTISTDYQAVKKLGELDQCCWAWELLSFSNLPHM
jgi:hypothetical protein